MRGPVLFAQDRRIGCAELGILEHLPHINIHRLPDIFAAEDAGAGLESDEGEQQAKNEEDAELTHEAESGLFFSQQVERGRGDRGDARLDRWFRDRRELAGMQRG